MISTNFLLGKTELAVVRGGVDDVVGMGAENDADQHEAAAAAEHHRAPRLIQPDNMQCLVHWLRNRGARGGGDAPPHFPKVSILAPSLFAFAPCVFVFVPLFEKASFIKFGYNYKEIVMN